MTAHSRAHWRSWDDTANVTAGLGDGWAWVHVS